MKQQKVQQQILARLARRLRCSGLFALIGLALMLGLGGQAQGQALAIPGLPAEPTDEEVDKAELQRSLDDVITLLENDQQRQVLLESLRDLQRVNAATEPEVVRRGGLLGALAETLDQLGDQIQSGSSPTQAWRRQLNEGGDDLGAIVEGTEPQDVKRVLIDAGLLIGVWSVLVIAMVAAGRTLATRYGWPHDLPRDPYGRLMVLHFLRRMLPWVIAFLLVLAMGQLLSPSPGRTLALVIAYVALCGRTLSVVFETVVAFFSQGHRFTAVRLLHLRALRSVFTIGALIALADAVTSSRLDGLFGDELASLLSTLINILAALLSLRFIVKFKRPIRHLICHRRYSLRRDASSTVELSRSLGGMWYVPAFMAVFGSLVAMVLSVEDVGTALARSIISASLLVLTLVLTGLLKRQAEHLMASRHHQRKTEYRRRLQRFGFVLAHLLCWMAFAELLTQVWGGSLFGVGRDGVTNARLGEALFSLGATLLLAWLVWILADTAIQRALISTARSRGRRVNQARAQTITPMIRNVTLVIIVIIASIAGLANLGVNVTPLLAGAGVVGLAIGFGAQTLVQDLITGIFIVVEDSLAVDDFVQINGHMGTVEGLTLRTVRLRDLDGVVHIFTFSRIESIHNMSRQFGIALMKIRIPHRMKIDDATTLMQETAQALRQDPMMRHYIWSPLEMQGIQAFEDGCPVLRMRFKTAPEMQWDVSRAFNLLLRQNMEQQGIDLSVARLSVSMEPGVAQHLQEKESAVSMPRPMAGSAQVHGDQGPNPDASHQQGDQ